MTSPPKSPKRVSQRQPRACLECTRRKTRCDKAIPCGRCVRLSKPCSREVVRVTKIERIHGSELAFLHGLCGILQSSGDVKEALAAIQERRSALLHGKGPEMSNNTSSTSSPDGGLSHNVEAGETACSPAMSLGVCRGLGEDGGDVSDSDLTEHEDTDKDQRAANFLRIELLAWGRHGGACFPHVDCDCRSIRPYSEVASIIADPEWNGYRYVIPDLSSQPIFLPDTQARALILFHFENILWHHNVFHAPTFLTQCEHFWTTGTVIHPLWICFYYSVIAVSSMKYVTYTISPCISKIPSERSQPGQHLTAKDYGLAKILSQTYHNTRSLLWWTSFISKTLLKITQVRKSRTELPGNRSYLRP